MPVAKEWVSIDLIREYCGITDNTLCRWIKHWNFPTHMTERIYKAKLSEVEELVINKDGLTQRIL